MRRTPSERDETENSMNRRSYLALAGATLGTAAVAGCLGGSDEPESGREVRFGYGGGPVLLSVGSAALAAASATSENEPNDTCTNAQAVSTDTDVSGTLESAGVDWYGVELSSGEDYDVVFDRVPSAGVTNVVLYGPDCAFKTLRQVGSGSRIQISATARESGTHYVEIVDVQEGNGDYTMRVDTESASATPSPTDTATATPSPTATTVADEYGEQGYGGYGYGGVSN
jgi:hypothetical protein